MQEKLVALLLDQDELGWRKIIYELVESEQMDPWDIDVSLLAQKFIKIIREMQEHDLKIPGKIVLAAAILLKIKATHLVENDISNLDRLLNQTDEMPEDELFGEIEAGLRNPDLAHPQLIPRNPQPRNRKVSVHDLVEALQRAMASKKRILAQQRPVAFPYRPHRKTDIMDVIKDVYHKITYYYNKDKEAKVTYTKLLPPKAGKQEKVYTFMPLLHLENEHKIEMDQPKHFDEITISLAQKGKQKSEQ
ncbi:MAG TPA: segregation/condensation protein A [Candidatus Nanoarchaeia archaeon]|nr:segregation/condensation protein A [Candidatus Nanoarchaeia archaeon]